MVKEELFSGSVRGAMHIAKDLPRQDAAGTLITDKYKIFVTADGHGSKAYFRSDEGSQMAVDIAIKNLSAFAEAFENYKKKHNEKSDEILEEILNPSINERRIRKVIMSIINQWKDQVEQAIREKPFTEEELNNCGSAAKDYRKGVHLNHVYGTTMLAGLLTEDFLLLIHQGDGRIVVFDAEGKASQPVPWDERCYQNVSTSMCDSDAIQSCRYIVIPTKENAPIATFLCCDGVEDSFNNMDATYGYCRKLLQICCDTSVKEMESQLPQLLDELSQEGSQDDVTITGFVNVEAVRPFVDSFSKENERIELEAQLAYVKSKLVSMERKHQYLKEQCEDVVRDKDTKESIIVRCKEELDHILTKISDLKSKKAQVETETENAQKEVAEVSDKLMKVKQEYDEYHAKYLAFEKERDELEAQLKALNDNANDSVDVQQENHKEILVSQKEPIAEIVEGEASSKEEEISDEATLIETISEEPTVIDSDNDEE